MNSEKSRREFTFISRTAPYGSNRPQLCLDLALAAAVFEQTINYVFLGDGVYQLLTDQNAEAINSKTLGNALETLDLYGISQVYVDRASLEERKLSAHALLTEASLIDADDLRRLIQQSDSVFNL